MVVLDHGVLRPRDIGIRHFDEGHGQRLDDEIIDRDLPEGLALLVLRRLQIEAFTQAQKIFNGAINAHIEMRNCLLGFREAARNDLAHAIVGHEIVTAGFVEFENNIIRHGMRQSSGAGLGGGRGTGFGAFNIFQNHAAMRAGAFQCGKVDALLLGDAPGER